MKPSLIKKRVIISFILLIPFILALRSYSLSIQNNQPPSTLERIEAFFENRDKVGMFLNKRYASFLQHEAYLSRKLGDTSESAPIYQETLSYYAQIINDPNSTKEQLKEALVQSAKININLGNFTEAIKICQEALETYPKNRAFLSLIAEIYYFRAAAHQGEGQYEQAIEQLQKILALENLPPNWYAFTKNHLASLYFKKGENDTAITYLRSIIEDHPSLDNWQGSAHYDLARYYLRQKDYPKAQEHLKTIIIKHPNSGWVKPAKDKLKEP